MSQIEPDTTSNPPSEGVRNDLTVRVPILSELLTSTNTGQVYHDSSYEGSLPACEKNLVWMFYLTGIRFFHSKYRVVKWTIAPLLCSLVGVACLCPLWYPSYYFNQVEVWTTDMILMFFVYARMLYLNTKWESVNCLEHIGISRVSNWTCLTFYILFQVYWFYFAIVMFSIHSEPFANIQLGNILMSSAWYIFFTTAGVLYYFICTKLLQRSMAIKLWLTTLRGHTISIDRFYNEYNKHFKASLIFSRNWNFIIFLAFLLLTIHVPIDILSIVVDGNLYDIPGAVIKGLALSWYIYCICLLNDYDGLVVSHLYKQRMFSIDDMQMIEQYTSRRRLGLNFYGIQINSAFVMKVVLISLNIILPAAYSFLKKFVFKQKEESP